MSLPPREHVLAPLLPVKGLAMLYAQRGVGKTHVALGIAHAIATGSSYLRWRAPIPREMLYVDGEMPAEAMQERLRLLPAGWQGRLRVLSMDAQELTTSLNLALPDHQAIVEAALGSAEFLVLDNRSTLVSGGRENDAESWSSMQGWFLHLRRKGITVLLCEHAGRSENARGTSKREDVLDTIIHLRRPGDYQMAEGARFEVHLTKARGVFGEDAKPFEARMEVQDGQAVWTVRELNDVEADRVAELTRDGLSVRDIAEETGLTKSKVNRIQARLRSEGVL